MSTYARAKLPTPVYSTPNLSHKNLEVIALPSTRFTILKEVAPNICQISTDDYPSSAPLFADIRFLEHSKEDLPSRKKELPAADHILNFMKSKVGTRYLWGGNWADGIPEMARLYPDKTPSEDFLCKGVDCSGLLYQATNGFTPRNTSGLFSYGQELQVDQDAPLEVQRIVKPLDMMVWVGHVVFVLDPGHLIESVGGKGVIISDFIERYSHYHAKLKAENKPFSLRRWHPHFLA